MIDRGHAYGKPLRAPAFTDRYPRSLKKPGSLATRQARVAAFRMAMLEQTVIKDNTLMPGEWYGGNLTFEPPQAFDAEAKTYSISIPVGDEVHVIDISQSVPR